jgi:hypothetical protein
MTEKQKQVLDFWDLEKRGLAVFEGKTIRGDDIRADAELAARYWDQQLKACYENFRMRSHY